MTVIRLYFDEDAGKHSVVSGVRQAGIDVITTLEAGNSNFPDTKQLLWSTTQNRVIYTFNMGDFCRLHKDYLSSDKIHAGIIVAAKQSYSVGQQIKGLLNIIELISEEEMINQLVFLRDYIG